MVSMIIGEKNKISTKEKGITLIALVVTIIVLLILAGVSIQMLTGQNGILTQAREAKKQTEEGEEKEQRTLAMLEAAMNTKTYTFVDVNKEKVTIPAGFAPTGVEGENTVENGFVITDEEGNEFVWIPCEYDAQGSEFDENIVYYNNADGAENNDTREDNWKEHDWFYNGGEWYDSQPHTIGKASLTKEGITHGFYVGRYEAGIPTNANFYVSNNSVDKKYKNNEGYNIIYYNFADAINSSRGGMKDSESVKNLKPVSKKNVQAWNYITQTNAKTVSENMYNTSNSVGSYLIDSHAWNAICKVMLKRKILNENDLIDSTKWGNYYENNTTKYTKINGLYAIHKLENGVWTIADEYKYGLIPANTAPVGNFNNVNRLELGTGVSEDFKKYNIYDLAGNMWEWTTEKGISNGNVFSCTNNECHDTEYPKGINGNRNYTWWWIYNN